MNVIMPHKTKTQRRAAIETSLAELAAADVLLSQQTPMRVEQAIKRYPSLRDLLMPVLVHVTIAQRAVRLARNELAHVWQSGEDMNWQK